MAHHHGNFVCRSGSYDVIECVVCGFKHLFPLPTEEELERIYQKEYYTSTIPDYIQRHQRDSEWWTLSYKNRLNKIKALTLSGGGRFLDVGSGPGLMLHAASELGFDAFGIEPNSVAADYARSTGCQVIEDFLSPKLAETLEVFDTIHSSEVLEHIRDPLEMIVLMGSLLKPGGTICIVVPNDFNPLQQALIDSGTQTPWWVAPPHHINYFTHKSLEQLVCSAGFDIVSITSTFPIELFLAMGDNYIGDDVLGGICHAKRKAMELLLIHAGHNNLLDDLYQKFSEIGIGREIILIGRKPLL